MKAYFDTSFLVSLYTPDANSTRAARAMQTSSATHLISTLGRLEAANALELRVFRKEISAAQANSSLSDFEKDLQQGFFQLIPLPERVFERAHQLSRRTTARLGTRTADLLHVAAAIELKADYLYSFDQQQRKLAQVVRLKTNRIRTN
ncbi:MAG: type II toxin-antitoxin system VapC family toxin [Bryobacteraceae bacterium]